MISRSQLAHARDDDVLGLGVGGDDEGRVLLGQAVEGDRELVDLGAAVGDDRHGEDGGGELDGFEDDRVVLDAQRVAGHGVGEADDGADLARVERLDDLAAVGVHADDAADPLLLVLGRVEDVGAGLEGAGVDADEDELADVLVGHDLEGEGGEAAVVLGDAFDLRAFEALAADRREVDGAGQVVDDGVEEAADADVADGAAAEDGADEVGVGGLADGRAQPWSTVISLVVAELLEQMLVDLADPFDEVAAPAVGVRRGAWPGSAPRERPCRRPPPGR